MSTLNKAFIKAYQRRGVGTPHIPLTASPPDRPEPAFEEPLAAAKVSDRVESVVDDGPAAVEPKPAPDPSGAQPALESQPALVPHPSISARTALQTQPAPAPDSTSETEHYLAPSGDLIPAFEVERFEWPQAVTALVKNSSQLGALMGELLPDGRGTLMVSGCRRGEGRTSVALLLARHLGRSGARVAIVDADVEQPQLASRLGMLVEAGWETGLTGELPAGEALIESLRDRLTLVPLKRPVSDREASDTGVCLKQLIERLRAEFEVVCLDAGPLAESGETKHEALFGQTQIDAAVVVRDVRHCRPEQTHAVGRKLAQLGVSRWAVVENFCGAGAPAA